MDKHIVFKGNKLTRTRIKNNILRIYVQGNKYQENDWYQDAHRYAQYLSEQSGLPTIVTSGIISALSPQTAWDYNKRIALQFVRDKDCGQTNANKNKAMQIYNSGFDIDTVKRILNGNKTKSFFDNIFRPANSNAVTIDRHAISIALGRRCKDNEQQLTTRQYDWFADCYRWVAKQLGIRPSMLQSITWETWRDVNNIG